MLDGKNSNGRGDKKGPQIRPNRMKPSSNVPNEEQIAAIKRKKKVIWFSFWSNSESMIWRTVILLGKSQLTCRWLDVKLINQHI